MPSCYACYQGNKRLNPLATLPLFVIVAQKDDHTAFTEHFIFTGFDKFSLLESWTGLDRGDVSQEDFNYCVTLDNLIEAEMSLAKAHFENSVYQFDPKMHSSLFLEGRLLEYVPVDDNPFRMLVMSQKYKSEIKAMFDGTESDALDGFKKLFQILTRINIQINPEGNE